jgi:pentatricopeptide repeat protein
MALLEANCVPTEDTYALLLRAYCNAGQLHRAAGVISEMQENGIPPSMHLKLHSSDFSDENTCTSDQLIRRTVM